MPSAYSLSRGAATRLGSAGAPLQQPYPTPPLERAVRRYQRATAPGGLRVGAALRASLPGYGVHELRRDVLAGCVVGVVALPLSMALAIATGMPPEAGLYTAIVAGFVTALLGGSPTQVSGPTAAFVVVLAPITARYGASGLLAASALAGLVLMAMGLLRLGRLIQFVPHPVTTGFTAGIAVVIATLQVRDVLGLTVAEWPEHWFGRVVALVGALPTARWPDAVVAGSCLALLLALPRVVPKVPAPLLALPLAAALAAALAGAGYPVDTIATRFGGIPQTPPVPVFPTLGLADLGDLVPSALAIAMLGAIESLLSAVVADGMAGTRHDPDAELFAQGAANVVSPLFGGFASTGAIARTATNIRAGGRSPIAAATHALVVLASVLFLAPALGYLPMAALAALLLLVAWNMSDARHFVHVVRVAPRADVAVLVTCFALTVVYDMVVAVSVGVVLASLLFMSRMAELTGAEWITADRPAAGVALPPGVVLYRIDGPLFFGAAQKAMAALPIIGKAASRVILDLTTVPAIDATGLVALESALDGLARDAVRVTLVGVRPNVRTKLERAGLGERPALRAFAPDVATALAGPG